jgi:hypothetical protein
VTVEITLLVQPDCGLCSHAEAVLERLAGEFPLQVRHVDLATPEGQELGARSGMAFPPAVLVDGDSFGFGRLSERRLRRELNRRIRSSQAAT